MKRYALFHGSHFYPSGGWKDFAGTFDSAEDAEAALENVLFSRDWYEIVDLYTGVAVKAVG